MQDVLEALRQNSKNSMFRLLEALREEDQEVHLEQELHQEEEDLHWKHLH